jgi:hypothetical protein
MTARVLEKYKLHLAGRWGKGGTEQAENYTFFSREKGMKITSQGQVSSYTRESYQWLGE